MTIPLSSDIPLRDFDTGQFVAWACNLHSCIARHWLRSWLAGAGK